MPELKTAQPARHPSPTAKALRLAYLIFDRPDLDLATRFLTDFGLRIVLRTPERAFLRATGPAPFCYVVERSARSGFAGLAFEVEDRGALEALSRGAGGSGSGGGIEAVTWPGGGLRLTLADPSGRRVDAICGQAPAEPLDHRAALPLNHGPATSRVNHFQRSPVAPPEVIRLGHVVLAAASFQTTCSWYTRHFGLIPSDVQVLPDGSPAVVFMRLDLGETPTDHHTLALAQGVLPAYSHSAYEVVDADAVGMGQRILRERGYEHAWGIGRHILGSQLFDYWCDPFGDKHEHYTDGDLLTSEVPPGLHEVSRAAMSQWGPVMPDSFTRPRVSPRIAAQVIASVIRTPDLSFRKLVTLARLFG